MCESCGCSGPEGGYKIYKPGEGNDIQHTHTHSHGQGHEHIHEHSHSHGHGHSHDHEHGHTHSHVQSHSHSINVEQDILSVNNLMAERNRGYFEAKNIMALNLVSSPGSGKTTLLESTIKLALQKFTCYVIEGDQQTDNDAKRIASTGAQVLQINTGNACHLDSNMIHESLHQLKPQDNSFVFIENVGNLVCPALFDLGEKSRVVIFSVTEGEDKPLKYPNMFHTSDICVISKIDLLPYLDFKLELARQNVLRVNPKATILEISVKTGEGMDLWMQWLESKIKK